MFLMNSSPLVALQRKWEPFAPSRACRYPACFSEAEDDIGRSAVSTKVQMIINNLQTEEASLGASGDYGCVVQKKQNGPKGRSQKLQSTSRLLQKHVAYTQQACPAADSDGMEVEEGSEFGPLSLNSDSDDSVDRDIEDAIQEYLRNKSQNTQSSPAADGEAQIPQGLSPSDAIYSLFPAHFKAGQIPQPFSPGEPGGVGGQAASSPRSTSSDDSFEQSIQAEIEQFLHEKKQQAREKILAEESKWQEEKPGQEKPAGASVQLRSSRESHSSLNRAGRVVFERWQRPEPQGPSKSEQKSREERSDFKTCHAPSEALSPCHPCVQASSKEDWPRTPPKTRRNRRSESAELSDSSSDDGIEEAIQLYQLEKIRKAAALQRSPLAFPKGRFGAGRTVDPSAHPVAGCARNTLPKQPRRGLSSKRQAVGSKPADSEDAGATGSQAEKGRSCAPLEDALAKPTALPQTSCRADTAAELMCAEAILDISKAILPPPPGSLPRPLKLEPPSCSPSVSPLRQESDSNAVDSDDSIEQEIRAFLAIKARTERSKEDSLAGPPSSSAPNGQTGNPRWASPKAVKRPLNQRRSLKGGRAASRQRLLPEDSGGANPWAPRKHTSENLAESNEAGGVSRGQQDPLLSVQSITCMTPASRGPLDTEDTPKYSTGDKSSSLDSDEDLDTAIKDLLRSKRKLKKKPKGQRIPCKKKVRFSDPEMRVFEGEERESKCNTATLLKSCLVAPKRDIAEEPPGALRGKPKTATALPFECKTECQTQPVSGAKTPEDQRNYLWGWTATSLTDESSSMDSDDGIEQEIQKFLAKKAKDCSANALRPPEAKGTDDALLAANPHVSLPKAKPHPLKVGSHTSAKQNGKGKRGDPVAATLGRCLGPEEERAESVFGSGEQTGLYAKPTTPQRVVKLQAKAPCFPAARRLRDSGRLDQSSLPHGQVKTDNSKVQNYLTSLSPFKRKTPAPGFKASTIFKAGLRSAHCKEKRQNAEFPWPEEQEGVPAPTLPGGQPCGASLPGSRSQTCNQEANSSAWCLAEATPPPLAEDQGTPVATLRHTGETLAKADDLGERALPCSTDPNLADVQRTSVCARQPRCKVPDGEATGGAPEQDGKTANSWTQKTEEQTPGIPVEAPTNAPRMPEAAPLNCLVKSKASPL